MTSKYDDYWAGQLSRIRAELPLAVTGVPTAVGVPDLPRLGERQSWYGVAEVRGKEVTYSAMAHATSLGKVVAGSDVCGQWLALTFRFTIGTAGDVLTITAAGRHRERPGRLRPERGQQSGLGRQLEDRNAAPLAASARRDRVPGRVGVPQADVDEFYRILGQLARKTHGPRRLRECTGSSGCPLQGVYFFYEDGETCPDGSNRAVRVGTHALTTTSQTTLWGRLRQHRGQLAGRQPGGGNHRASVFRRHVGAALIRRDGAPDDLCASWLDRHHPTGELTSQEAAVELAVSRYIGAMPFLWLSVPGRADRGYLESNSIALLSRLTGGPGMPSSTWLGRYAERAEIRESGLWNVQHVTDHYEPEFLQRLAQLVDLQR